jgi:hypothetical protein
VKPEFDLSSRLRSVLFVLLGAALLMSKRWYSGPFEEMVHCYLGNVSVSFAVYYLFANIGFPPGLQRLIAASCALTVVELFEAFDGFGVMANTYDPFDFLANAAGITMALLTDVLLGGKRLRNVKSPTPSPEQK